MKNFSALSWPILLGLIIRAPLSRAQTAQSIAEREAARRQAQAPHGEQAITRAQEELRRKEFGQAHEDFRLALTYVSDSKATGRSYERAVEGFCESGVRLAEQRIAEGRYAEAEAILTEILSDRYNPRCKEAATLLAHLRDPGYINKTMGPKFLAKVEEVRRLLTIRARKGGVESISSCVCTRWAARMSRRRSPAPQPQERPSLPPHPRARCHQGKAPRHRRP